VIVAEFACKDVMMTASTTLSEPRATAGDDLRQRPLLAAFLAADQAAAEADRRREFRRALIMALPVSPAVQRLLLAMDALCQADGLTDEAGNDWVEVTRSELAHAMDRSESAARIQLRTARLRGLVSVEESPGRPNLIGLLWPAIFALAPPIAPPPPSGLDRGGCVDAPPIAPPIAPPPPFRPKTGGGGDPRSMEMDLGDGVGVRDLSCNHHQTKTPPPTPQDGAGVLEKCSERRGADTGERPGRCFRWGRSIEPAELRDLEAIDELYAIAVGAGLARDSEQDRLAFVALVAHVLAQTSVKNPVALLTSILTGRCRDRFQRRNGDWRARPGDRDWEVARSLLRRRDREERGWEDEPQPTAAYDVEAVRVREFEAERRRQQQALREAVQRGTFD